MSSANPSRLSLQQEINAANSMKDNKISSSMLKILNETATDSPVQQMITALAMNQTPIVNQSPAISALSFSQRRQVIVSAAPSHLRQQYEQQANCSGQIISDQQSTLYGESPIPSPQHQHQSVAKLFQLNESESNSPVNLHESVEEEHYQEPSPTVEQHIRPPGQSSSTLNQHQLQHQQASTTTPFERLLPHHHEQIREQLKIIPPPTYSPRPPVIVEPHSVTASQVQVASSAPAVSGSHHTSSHRFVSSSESHHSQAAQILESHSAHLEAPLELDAAAPLPHQQQQQQQQQQRQSQLLTQARQSQQHIRQQQHHRVLPQQPIREAYIPPIQRIPFDPQAPLDIPGSIPFTPQLIIDGVSTQRQGRFKDQYEQYKVRQYDVYYITIKGPIENMKLEPCLQNNEFKVLVN